MRHLPPALHFRPDQIGAIVFAIVAVSGVTAYILSNRKVDPEEVERQRRLYLAEQGRITDATLIDPLNQRAESASEVDLRLAEPSPFGEADGSTLESPRILLFQYRVAGVGYENSQDVSLLPGYVRNVRIDLPIQVRYDPKNPGNSIVVAESWSGLRIDPSTAHE